MMSANYPGEETSNYSYYINQGYHETEESFTDLQSCDLQHETDSHSSDVDDDQQEEEFIESRTIKESITTTTSGKSSDDIEDLIRDDLYKFVFMPMSKQMNNYVSCRLVRNKFDMFHVFHLEIERQNGQGSFSFLTAEKPLNIAGPTQYTISVSPKFSNDSYSIELISNNLSGTSYSLFDRTSDEHQQLAVILYESNFLGLKGPRKIEALLPRFNNDMQSLFDDDEVVQYNSSIKDDSFIHIHNKPPACCPYTGDYILSFNRNHHMIKPSVKNFQMVIQNDERKEQIIMQFGRMSDNDFFCDFCYPLSLIQAFGIALSAFDSRLFRD